MTQDSSAPAAQPDPQNTSPPGREISWLAIGLGLVLSVIMGAANVYLGLKAGMTVAASIPAAVIAMGVLRGVFRRSSILEANLVQTAASAGESLAAGIIFTIPAIVMLGIWDSFHYFTTSLIALAGGLLGVLLMIPMRKVFVVDDKELIYPEGVACAEVLKAGSPEEGTEHDPEAVGGVLLIIAGIVVGAAVKFASSFFLLIRSGVEWATSSVIAGGRRIFFFGADISPALLAVGYVVGLSIAVQIFIGGAIGWVVTLPMLDATPAAEELALASQQAGAEAGEVFASGAEVGSVEVAKELGTTKIRFLGVGAMIVGGLASIWKVRKSLVVATREMFSTFRKSKDAARDPTQENMPASATLALAAFCVLMIGGIYYYLLGQRESDMSSGKLLGMTVLTTAVMIVMAFFFTAVASYIVGLVGNSNSPVSGMTITAMLGTALLMIMMNFSGEAAMIATLGVAGVVCCVACTAGDVCNDLKTGVLVGARPRSQQILQVLGVCVAAFALSPVMTVLDEGSKKEGTGGIGGSDLKAPQAGLFASLAQGFFGEDEPDESPSSEDQGTEGQSESTTTSSSTTKKNELPKTMLYIGVGIGLALLVADFFLEKRKSEFRLHVMPVAVGIYLSLGLTVPILLGGLLHFFVSRNAGTDKDRQLKRGVLIASGVIAGEALIGVLLGFLAWINVKDKPGDLFVFGNIFGTQGPAGDQKLAPNGELAIEVVSLLVLLGVAAWMYFKSRQRAK